MRAKKRNDWQIADSTIVVAHISNMTPLKNVSFVIQVFNTMLKKKSDCKLLLIGKEIIPNEVQNLIAGYNIDSKILNLGVCDDIPDILQGIDVCLMPSKSEGFGLVAVECQAASVPVITSDGFPPDIYVSEKAHRLTLHETEWADTAISVAMESKQNANLKHAMERYDSKVIAARMEDFYRQL